jgi:hypothetical protein
MSDRDEERYWELIGKLTGLRDVVTRLLAYHVSNASDSAGMLRDFSEATAYYVYLSQKHVEDSGGNASSEALMKLQDVIQSEVDGIVADARRIVAGSP